MTPQEASASLTAFAREHGRRLTELASHAAMPSVLSAELLHLLRINYFLDPPRALAYEAEASVLLSRLCTEIDDGLYVIDPELRDLLLRELTAQYGASRVRDVARLLWEYNGRGTPWGNRPGLVEAQQLTALNFIDPGRAQAWLARARRGEGSLPVRDDRWFIALQRDLAERSAAVSHDPESPTESLPTLRKLCEAVVAAYAEPFAALRIGRELGLPIPDSLEREGPASLWRSLLDSAWITSRMTELLDRVSKDLEQSTGWEQAVREYWIKVSPPLRIENGRFESPGPEWAILELHRVAVEQAIRATVVLVIQEPSHQPRILGLGSLAGDNVVMTHISILGDTLRTGFGPNSETKIFAEFTEDHPDLGYVPRLKRRIELIRVAVDQKTGFIALNAEPATNFSAFPDPLQIMTHAPFPLKGRKVCVAGYPMVDPRINPEVPTHVLKTPHGGFRLMPGEILGEDTAQGILIHNCFTAPGTGGSPVIDIETGEVLGVHFAAKYDPNSLGLKQRNAVSTLRLLLDLTLANTGIFSIPVKKTYDKLADPSLQGSNGSFSVLVVGTGWIDVPRAVENAAKHVGAAIANAGCTLVTGGWSGVDHIAARSFSATLGNENPRLANDLVQVLEGEQKADFQGQSRIVRVAQNLASNESLKFADVVILIGGAGGTWETFRSALSAKKPVIAFLNTGTDARRAAILLEIFGQNVPIPLLNADFDDDAKAQQAEQLLQAVLAGLKSGASAQRLENEDLLWMTETVLPLADSYLRRNSGIEDDASLLYQEFINHELSRAKYDQMVSIFLEDTDPVWRCIAYIALEVKAQSAFVIRLVNTGVREVALALDRRETRPLWRWLVAIGRLVDAFPYSFPDDLLGSLQNAVRAIRARPDVDSGGECKSAIYSILEKLTGRGPRSGVLDTATDQLKDLPSQGKSTRKPTVAQPLSTGTSLTPLVSLGQLCNLALEDRCTILLRHDREGFESALHALATTGAATNMDTKRLAWAVVSNIDGSSSESGNAPNFPRRNRGYVDNWPLDTEWPDIWEVLVRPLAPVDSSHPSSLLSELAFSVACEQRDDWQNPSARPIDPAVANRIFEIVYARDKSKVLRLCRSLATNPMESESIAAEAWSRVFTDYWSKRATRRFLGLARISTMVFQVARFIAIDSIRREARFVERDEELSDEEPLSSKEDLFGEIDPSTRILADELYARAAECISHLPTKRRLVAEMVWLREISARQVAQILKVSESTISQHLKLARESVRICLKQHGLG
jgi:RNA polymerase sigma factor (sigma-70 family)